MERIDLVKNVETTVAGVTSFQNRSTGVVYWTKDGTEVQYGASFTSLAHEKEFDFPAPITLRIKASSDCFITVEK